MSFTFGYIVLDTLLLDYINWDYILQFSGLQPLLWIKLIYLTFIGLHSQWQQKLKSN